MSCATYAELGPQGRGGGRGDSGSCRATNPTRSRTWRRPSSAFSGGATLNLEAGWAAYRESSDDFGVTLYGTDGGAR